ncbi:MAG TPA: preprotein translocase subunit SecG [Kofleriaceae bacterium]|nr:preprotein translocase subunit SecG [Kofleriaceae bacterium]
MSTLITILHIIVCLFLMLTVLLQSGKGGGMGGAFGGGNAATVFGGSGASTFLRRLTAIAGSVFMVTSMVLAFVASRNQADSLEKFGEQQQKLAAEKQAAREKSTFKPGANEGSGSASGSASEMTPMTPTGTTPAPGTEAGSAGAINPTGQPHGGSTGSAATPAEIATPTKPGELPTPATPSTMSPAPDKKPEAKPNADTTKPSPEAKPAATDAKPAATDAKPAAAPADPAKPADAPKP